MKNRILTFLAPALLLVALGCSSTKFTTAEKAEDVGRLDLAGKKVAALVIHADLTTRIEAENVLAEELTKRGMVGVAVHTLLPAADLKDAAKTRAAIKQAAPALVVTRLVGVKSETHFTPIFDSHHYSYLGPYYDYGFQSVHTPGYYDTYQTYGVETLCYRTSDEKLVWSGASETFAPGSTKEMVRSLVNEAGKVMKKQGLIAVKK